MYVQLYWHISALFGLDISCYNQFVHELISVCLSLSLSITLSTVGTHNPYWVLNC